MLLKSDIFQSGRKHHEIYWSNVYLMKDLSIGSVFAILQLDLVEGHTGRINITMQNCGMLANVEFTPMDTIVK